MPDIYLSDLTGEYEVPAFYGDFEGEKTLQRSWLKQRVQPEDIDADEISDGNQTSWLKNFSKPYELWFFESSEKHEDWCGVRKVDSIGRVRFTPTGVYAVAGYAVLKDDEVVGWYITGHGS